MTIRGHQKHSLLRVSEHVPQYRSAIRFSSRCDWIDLSFERSDKAAASHVYVVCNARLLLVVLALHYSYAEHMLAYSAPRSAFTMDYDAMAMWCPVLNAGELFPKV
jgi:hypothetical protein